MTTDPKTLARKLELWYATNQPRPSPALPVEVEGGLPEGQLDSSRVDKQMTQKLQEFRVFSRPEWEPVCRDMSALASRLSDPARQRLIESLGVISAPPPVSPELLRKWLAAVGSLLPGAYSAAVMEFFQLAWMWEQLRQVTGLELEQVLVLLFKGLRALGEGPRSAAMMHFL
ncbi:hypothetical protein JW921_03455, partial [Candidatus Fermentibacterales bacterium]|nr:hypothetical protein [Candidatus Fermentibacterales bacterium]